MNKTPGKIIIIKGVTRDGRKFRPSDWAQRLTSAVASYYPSRGHQRRSFHPNVRMATIDGVNCVLVDAELEQNDPMLFEFLMKFGEGNNLEVVRQNEGVDTPSAEEAVAG